MPFHDTGMVTLGLVRLHESDITCPPPTALEKAARSRAERSWTRLSASILGAVFDCALSPGCASDGQDGCLTGILNLFPRI